MPPCDMWVLRCCCSHLKWQLFFYTDAGGQAIRRQMWQQQSQQSALRSKQSSQLDVCNMWGWKLLLLLSLFFCIVAGDDSTSDVAAAESAVKKAKQCTWGKD